MKNHHFSIKLKIKAGTLEGKGQNTATSGKDVSILFFWPHARLYHMFYLLSLNIIQF